MKVEKKPLLQQDVWRKSLVFRLLLFVSGQEMARLKQSVRTLGGTRLYCESIRRGIPFWKRKGNRRENENMLGYTRVSSKEQKADLERQINDFKQQYPNHEIIKDIASGLNYQRKGLLTLLEKCTKEMCTKLWLVGCPQRQTLSLWIRILGVVLLKKKTAPNSWRRSSIGRILFKGTRRSPACHLQLLCCQEENFNSG